MKKTIGNYDILKKIGAGAMSRVYLAAPHSLPEKRVAIKVLDPALAMDEEFVIRFEREARAVSFLQHGNVANIIDFGVEDGVHYYVMEYVSGSDLRQVMDDVSQIRETPGLPVGLVIYLLEEVAYGLGSAHERGIIHRDIKPTNIMLGLEGEVKVADFGLARSFHGSSSLPLTEATISGAFLGTATYASPEQAAKEQDLDARTDVFSLGVLAYELLTCRKPFVASDLDSTLRMIINDPHPPLAESPCSPVFPELVDLIDGMLAKQRDRRLTDMDAVLQALQACRLGLERCGIRYSNRRRHLTRLAADPAAYCRQLHEEAAAVLPDKTGPTLDDRTVSGEATIVPRGPLPTSEVTAPDIGTGKGGRESEPIVDDAPADRGAEREPPPSRSWLRRRWPLLAGIAGLAVAAGIYLYWSPFDQVSPSASGWVSVTCSVDGAQLEYAPDRNVPGTHPLDGPGVQTQTVGQRATVLALEPGKWLGEVSHDGHVMLGLDWQVAEGETSGVHFELREQGEESASLFVGTGASTFKGALVYIDGKLMGNTPITLENLTPGSYELRVEIEIDGKPYKETRDIELLPGMIDRLFISFTE